MTPPPAEPGRARTAAGAWHATAFGLSLQSDFGVLGFEPGRRSAATPATLLRRSTGEEIEAAWTAGGAVRLVEHRYPHGAEMMTVEAHPEHGYRIDAPGHGRFRVAGDGSLVECAPEPGPDWRWHRPLVAQALPMAAALSGLEVLHASGVALGGRGFAFVGHSGAGKTSLALHLADQGAELLADDVVALSADATPLAHPGVRFANVADEQLQAIPEERRAGLGRVVGRSEKTHLLVEPIASAPAPLGAIYFIDRLKPVRDVRFERIEPGLALLLSATFMPHVSAPRRLAAQLEICQSIAERVPAFELKVPTTVPAHALAPIVAGHARELTLAQT